MRKTRELRGRNSLQLRPELLGVFLKPIDQQARLTERSHHLTDRPLILPRLRRQFTGRRVPLYRDCWEIPVGARALVEIPAAIRTQSVGIRSHVPEPVQRMPVVDVKTPAMSKESRNPASPTPEIRDPGKRPLTGVDEIRSTIEFW